MATTAPGRQRPVVVEDPRLSARRRSVERSKLRRRFWIAGGLVGLVGLAFGAWALLHQPWFSARTVNVHGAVHETPAAVASAAGLTGHPPLISIDTSAAASGVEALPWVRTASVSLRWPSTVEIRVTERTPVAVVPHGARWLTVDATGRILAVSPAPTAGLVVVAVPSVRGSTKGASLGGSAGAAMDVAASLPPAFRSQVARVVGHSDGTVSLRFVAPIRVDLGAATELEAKYQDIASVIAGTTLHPGDVLDVSVPQASLITGP